MRHKYVSKKLGQLIHRGKKKRKRRKNKEEARNKKQKQMLKKELKNCLRN